MILPNAFILLWDELPIGFAGSWPVQPYPIKTYNPREIAYYPDENAAQATRFMLETNTPGRVFKIVEIKFEIQRFL